MRVRGAYMTVKEFLYTYRQGIVYSEKGNGVQDSWNLEKKRRLIIPDYQREYRWEDKQLTELISDIAKGQCYLGQIVVARNTSEPQRYYLVDGQQRMTSIIILLTVLIRQFYIANDTLNIEKYELHLPQTSDETGGLPRLNFDANCFESFQDFLSQIYTMSDEDLLNGIFAPPEKDAYRQTVRYINACAVVHKETLRRITFETTKVQQLSYVKELVNKILETQISVVIFDGNNSYESERVFLDINEKGLRLDNEDILKAYYFQIVSGDTGVEALNTWQSLKEAYFAFRDELSLNKIPFEGFVNYALQIELLVSGTVQEYNKFDNDLRYKDVIGKKHICELFADTHLHNSMKRVVSFFKEITSLLNSDPNSAFFCDYFGTSDSTTREVFKYLFTSICKSGMSIIYIALIKLWWLKNQNHARLTLDDIIQLFSFYVICNVSGTKKERVLFSNDFISAQNKEEAYENIHLCEIKLLRDASTNATTLKSDQEKGEYLSFNIQMFSNDFKYINEQRLWKLIISNQEFLSKYSANRETYIKDHFIIQNGNSVALYNGSQCEIESQYKRLRKRAYNFVYHYDDYGNVDFIKRLDLIKKKIEEIKKSTEGNIESILPWGQYELEYFKFVERTVRNYFELTDDAPWEQVLLRYSEDLPKSFTEIISYILKENIHSWNQIVCNSFSKQFSDELIQLVE